MLKEKISFTPIGIIYTPFTKREGMPIQPSGAVGIQGRIEVFEEYENGLADLEGFSHIILLYHFHLIKKTKLKVIPFLDTQRRGIFATRAPTRPNPIGLSIVKLVRREKNCLHVENIDIVNQTPLLDIKPYIPDINHHVETRLGWLEQVKKEFSVKKSDKRF